MDTNWESMGIAWKTEKVSKGSGNSKVEIAGDAQIPEATDLTKVIAHFGAEAVLGSVNGTSWRVSAQDVNRRMLPGKPSVEALRTAVYNRLRSIKNASVVRTVEVKVYALADGSAFKPDADVSDDQNLIAYKQAALAAYIDAGVPNQVAQNLISNLSL